MDMRRVLAFDFGASSGRAMIASYENGEFKLKEVHRFSNDAVMVNGVLYWDVLRLFHEIKQGIVAAKLDGGFDAIGIDTWGVDYAFIDADGHMMENPVHYRDTNAAGIEKELFEVVPQTELYARTGTQFASLNSIYRLYHTAKYRPEKLKQCDKLLFIPDLFAYFLTGAQRTELTFASTTNLLNPITRDWDYELLDKLGIPRSIFAKMIRPGESYGTLKPALAEELGCGEVPVIATASHDTASAVVSVPTQEQDFIYVSCGTWSLFGTELAQPLLTPGAEQANFTNEGGYGDTIRFLKNIMGMWLFQESCRQWKREGKAIDYKQLDADADAAAPFCCFINPDAAEFAPYGNMPKRIRQFCERTGQSIPQTDGEICRCIYESLAFKYRQTLEQIEGLTGKAYAHIHMVGGGINNKLLCQLAADYCNRTVIAGPVEATATGNAFVQLIALGDVQDLKAARRDISANTELNIYKPRHTAAMDEAYRTFLRYQG